MELKSDVLAKLQQYLSGEMDHDARATFDTEINNSKELQEFIGLYNSIDHLEDENSWELFNGDTDELKRIAQLFRARDTQAFSEKLKRVQGGYSEKRPKTKSPSKKAVYALMAACIAAIIYFLIPNEINMTTLYSEHSNWNELPSLVVKGSSMDEQNRQVEAAFKNKEFKSAISLSNNIIANTTEVDANIYLYKGIAQLELNQFDEALETFIGLTESNSIDNHKGYWYTALIYLKQENKEKATQALEQVVHSKGNYKYEQALKLLKELK